MMKLALVSGLVLATLTGGAFAADLIVQEDAAPVVVDTATGWDGAYIGASIGYGSGTATSDGFGPTTTVDLSGALAGIQAGYNYTLSNNLVIGFEGNLDWSNESGSTYFPLDGNYSADDKIEWTGAFTGHVGLALDNLMPYVLGGVAFASNTLSYYDYDLDQENSSETQTHTGYTVGVGLAAKLTDSLSAFAEYRYADYGTQDYANDTGEVGLTNNTVRVGLNFQF